MQKESAHNMYLRFYQVPVLTKYVRTSRIRKQVLEMLHRFASNGGGQQVDARVPVPRDWRRLIVC